jgi:hypothetical protein
MSPPFVIPKPGVPYTPTFTVSAITATASMALVSIAPKDGILNRVGVFKTTGGGGSTLAARIETVTGYRPSGTALTSGSTTVPATTNTLVLVPITPLAVAKGDMLATVLYHAPHVVATSYARSVATFAPSQQLQTGMPQVSVSTTFAAGSGAGWTNSTVTGITPLFSALYEDDSPLLGCWVPGGLSTASVVPVSGGVPFQSARFTLEYPAIVEAAFAAGRFDGWVRFELYDDDNGLVDATIAQTAGVGAATANSNLLLQFQSLPVLPANTTYRLLVKSLSGASNSIIGNVSMSASHQEAVFGVLRQSNSANGATWGDTNNMFPSIVPLVTPVAIGGIMVPRGFNGGFGD